MPQYRVTVRFDRLNPVTNKLEKQSVREGTLAAASSLEAKDKYLKQFRKNEPTRRKIHHVEVTKI